ncbi:MAG: NAD(P)-binding protein, partial [Candidatus Eremiobacteraeota bacterium]|nr:NAD(P)-binding protein [Candidatus Eremiobacteraeota bacterium]
MNDRKLGMERRISRRDFLDGVAVSVGAAVTVRSAGAAFGAEGYPPAETGLVGQTSAAYTIAHRLRDGTFWRSAPAPRGSGERYDLIVVGAGISGLAAAYFWQKQHPRARVLVIDNLDDFGGHAKRNEFRVRRRLLLANGGTQSLEQPSEYSDVAKGLLHELGVEPQRFYRYFERDAYHGLGNGVFFDRKTFGVERFVHGFGGRPWEQFFDEAPFEGSLRASLIRLFTQRVDYLADRNTEEKRRLLARTSYRDFLRSIARLDARALPFLQTWTHDFWGVGIDAVPALDVYESGDDYGIYRFPGFQGMDLGDGPGHWAKPRKDPYIFHFPDGNASVARLLVRALVPGSLAGSTMEDIVTARCRYRTLDAAENGVRIRLRSTAVRVRHQGNPGSADEVEVAYVRDGALETATAGHVILACWNTMVPYIAPELPERQRQALSYGVKVPLVYTRVAIRNWEAFAKLGVFQFIAPGSYFPYVGLDFPVSMGAYHFGDKPKEPMVLFLLRTPCRP